MEENETVKCVDTPVSTNESNFFPPGCETFTSRYKSHTILNPILVVNQVEEFKVMFILFVEFP